MSPRQTRDRTVRTPYIRLGSNEAIEDNATKSDSDSDENPHQRRWSVRLSRDQTTASPRLKNGRYGMFSTADIPLPSTPKSTASVGQPTSKHTDRKRKRSHGMIEERTRKHQQSPLFEPEDDVESVGDTSDSESTTMRSPSVTVTSKKRAKPSVVEDPISDRDETPTMVTDFDSECEIIEQHDNRRPSPDTGDLLAVAQILEDSPLPGNTSALPQYLETIDLLSEQFAMRKNHSDAIRNLDEEDQKLEKKIVGLPDEQTKQNEAIAENCAAAIQKDMRNRTFNSVQAINDVFAKRQTEAEKGREEVDQLMTEKRATYGLQREGIPAKKVAVEHELREVEEAIVGINEQKSMLERKGGLAMAFELGKMVEAKLGSRKRRAW
ncbi:hypothetical protein BKA66DRAFT_574858 [Pyrenochaeta sp. MPI-SDFR-AT-0127]|nr:hypothetical protein BKA66DRAFT_574858 [Pyrenochaeta sp. MPI-SDFR-AT-0127]